MRGIKNPKGTLESKGKNFLLLSYLF